MNLTISGKNMVIFAILQLLQTIIVSLIVERPVKKTEDYLLTEMIVTTFELSGIVPHKQVIIDEPEGFFRFYHRPGVVNHLNYNAAWLTVGLGCAAGKDFFQLVMASN